MPYGDWLKITDGTEQGARFPSALAAGYFNVDEMEFADLLAMGADLAARLNFYNLRNEKDGNWADLFTNDETVIMAMILSRDLKRLETEFLRIYAMGSDNLHLARRLAGFARMIDFWFRKLSTAENVRARALSWQIATIVENKLAADLHSLGACCRQSQGGDDPQDTALFGSFHEIWSIGKDGERLVFARAGIDGTEDKERVKGVLYSIFYSFLNALSHLKKSAAESFDDTKADGLHNPAMALFMAFLALYGKAREKINSFQQRHLDFYYRKLLHLGPRPPAADGAYLVFESNRDREELLIARGTEFSAGKDGSNREIVYRAESDLVVTDTRVQSLRTLFFKRDPLISPEHEFNFVTGVHVHDILSAGSEQAGRDARAWPLFGKAKRGTEQSPGGAATLGFALATPVFFLREGTRTVEITVYFTRRSTSADAVKEAASRLHGDTGTEEEYFKGFGKMISLYLLAGQDHLAEPEKKDILDNARGRISESSHKLISDLLLQDRQDLFYTIMPNIFSVALTGGKGWHEVSGVAIERAPARGRVARDGLKFVFTLGPEVAPVIPYSPQLHEGRYGTKLPLVRFLLNPKADFFACSLFDSVEVKEFLVEVRVRGVTDLLAYNNHGRLDPTKPFNPFGPIPTGNSCLIVGSYEVALKKLTELTLNIEWGELPREEGGFQEYYRGYGTPYTNDIFTADVSVMHDGIWLPGPGVPGSRTTLFDSAEGGDALSRSKFLSVGVLDYYKPVEPSLAEEMYRFDLRVRAGFFRLALAAPEGAFGHRDYPALLTRVLTANMKLKQRHQLPVPNAPYTPLINRVTIDYGASDIIKAETDAATLMDDFREKPFHIHPFGIETIHPLGFHYLIPHYQYDGNLFIGFTASRPGGVLTLFFHLREDSGRAAAAGPPEIAWFYLASNRWLMLDKARILSDSTDGFMISGIVTLEIPDDIDTENSVMPDDLYWLRVSAAGDLGSFCSLYSVRAQAVKVCRRMDAGAAESLPPGVPAGTIRGPLKTIPGVARVHQPIDSFGGRRVEEPSELRTRISERLRHKDRVTTPWDYERMVLERFPRVFKAKCFSVLDSGDEGRPRPGGVLVVVVPHMRECDTGLVFDPMLNATELNRIRAYLLRHTSPFVSLEVRNPVYERIQVRCRVALTRSAEARRGHCLAMLNRAIVDYLSPWSGVGCKVRFGWTIRRADVESYIRSLDYVEFVTKFSMLHITEDGKGRYFLDDTARAARGEETGTADQARPRYPWSLAIPFAEHHIETTPSLRSMEAEVTGINELQVGNTFIIGA